MARLIRWFVVCAIAGVLATIALLQIQWYHSLRADPPVIRVRVEHIYESRVDPRIVRVEHGAIRVDCDRADVLCDDEEA